MGVGLRVKFSRVLSSDIQASLAAQRPKVMHTQSSFSLLLWVLAT